MITFLIIVKSILMNLLYHYDINYNIIYSFWISGVQCLALASEKASFIVASASANQRASSSWERTEYKMASRQTLPVKLAWKLIKNLGKYYIHIDIWGFYCIYMHYIAVHIIYNWYFVGVQPEISFLVHIYMK